MGAESKENPLQRYNIPKPTEEELYEFKEAYGPLEVLVPDNPLNTDAYKKKLLNLDDVTCFAQIFL